MLYRFCVFLFITGSLFAADLSGDWELALKYLNDTSHARVKLKTDGDKLTGTLNELKIEGTCSQTDRAERAASFSRLLADYPHPPRQRENPAYEPMARGAWGALSDAQRAAAIVAAPHAPGKVWLGHWLNDGRETGIFETLKQVTACPRVWVSEGTPQHAAWAEHYRSRGCRLPRTQHRVDGELQTGWMFESKWPPNYNFLQSDGRAA